MDQKVAQMAAFSSILSRMNALNSVSSSDSVLFGIIMRTEWPLKS